MHECARRGAQLVEVHSAEKNTVLNNLLKRVLNKPYNLWLGGNDEFINNNLENNRPFFWSATGKQFNFTYWSEGNPSNFDSDEHCAHIYWYSTSYKWNDINCLEKMGFVCESKDFCT